jgi:hypothetical protein
MADVTSFEDVPLPADKVWSVIGDFAGIRKWAVLVQNETIEETPAGKVRVLTMGNGATVRELLVTSSDYSYTYTMADHPDTGDYRSTVAAIPVDESVTRIELILHATPGADQTEEGLVDRYTKFGRGNIKAMKKALGLA